MTKIFYFYDAKYEIDENGNLARSAYEDDRPHNYNGKIIILHRHNKRKVIKPYIDRYGYMQVVLKSKGHQKHFSIHQLVYMIFIMNYDDISDKTCGYDFASKNYVQINHIDGNKLNNHYSNLELITLQENIEHSIKHKLHNSQIKAQYVEIYKDNQLLVTVWKTREASKWLLENYNVIIDCGTISRRARDNKESKGFKFKYKV